MVGKLRVFVAPLLLMAVGLSACTGATQEVTAALSAVGTPSNATATSSPAPLSQVGPTAVMPVEASTPSSPLATPTPVPPTPSPTPSWGPYEDEPFTIVFTRNLAELWLAEIGGEGERLLTEVGEGRRIAGYAVSPDGKSIAYIIGTHSTEYGDVLNLLDMSTGEIREVDRAAEGRQLFMPGWCGPDQLTYYMINPIKPLEPEHPESGKLMSYVRLDVATGERTEEPAATITHCSPDGRYLLSGQYFRPPYYKPETVPYELLDLTSGESWMVTDEDDNAKFESWSPDGRFLLFSLYRDPDFTSLMTVDLETWERRVISPPDEAATFPAWSPDGELIVYQECGAWRSGCGCPELWLTSPDGGNRHIVPMGENLACQGGPKSAGPYIDVIYAAYDIHWTPDGARLVFSAAHNFRILEDIWSVKIDGTDLRPLVEGRYPRVLPAAK